MDNDKPLMLDTKTPGNAERELRALFREKMVSQDRAINKLARRVVLANAMGGRIRDLRKPAGVFLFLGPTGVGKTQLVKEFARILFGRPDAFTLVSCTGMQEKHEVSAKLLGAPAGYIGFDIEPAITQQKLDHWGFLNRVIDQEAEEQLEKLGKEINRLEVENQKKVKEYWEIQDEKGDEFDKKRVRLVNEHQKNKGEIERKKAVYDQIAKINGYKPSRYKSIVHFDEVEKADPSLFELLMPVFDEAYLDTHSKTRDGRNKVLFHNTFIFMTSNIGEEKIKQFLKGAGPIGFKPHSEMSAEETQNALFHIIMEELEDSKKSPIPLTVLGRIRKEGIVVFSPLGRNDFREGLDRIIIPGFVDRIIKSLPIELTVTEKAREYLVNEAFGPNNMIFGMRSLESVFQSRIEESLGSLIAKEPEEGGIIAGDKITIDTVQKDDKSQELRFSREPRTLAQIEQEKIVRSAQEEEAEDDHDPDCRVPAVFKIKKD